MRPGSEMGKANGGGVPTELSVGDDVWPVAWDGVEISDVAH